MRQFVNSVAAFAFAVSGAAALAGDLVENNLGGQTGSTLSVYDTNSWQRLLAVGNGAEATVWKAACCKVCRKGKACGNSCISRSYTCRKGRGCACDG